MFWWQLNISTQPWQQFLSRTSTTTVTSTTTALKTSNKFLFRISLLTRKIQKKSNTLKSNSLNFCLVCCFALSVYIRYYLYSWTEWVQTCMARDGNLLLNEQNISKKPNFSWSMATLRKINEQWRNHCDLKVARS